MRIKLSTRIGSIVAKLKRFGKLSLSSLAQIWKYRKRLSFIPKLISFLNGILDLVDKLLSLLFCKFARMQMCIRDRYIHERTQSFTYQSR